MGSNSITLYLEHILCHLGSWNAIFYAGFDWAIGRVSARRNLLVATSLVICAACFFEICSRDCFFVQIGRVRSYRNALISSSLSSCYFFWFRKLLGAKLLEFLWSCSISFYGMFRGYIWGSKVVVLVVTTFFVRGACQVKDKYVERIFFANLLGTWRTKNCKWHRGNLWCYKYNIRYLELRIIPGVFSVHKPGWKRCSVAMN